jgi:hypothetical protein
MKTRRKESKKRERLRERMEAAREAMLNAPDRSDRMRWHDTYCALAFQLEKQP